MKPIIIPDQIGGLFLADVQGPFEVGSLEGCVYKIGIIEATTRFLWMPMARQESGCAAGALAEGYNSLDESAA